MAEFKVIAGKTHNIKLTYKDGLGVPISVAGSTSKMVVRKDIYSPILFTTVGSLPGGVGEMLFTVNPADTINLLDDKCISTYTCGFELIQAGGEVVPFLEGSDFIVQQAVVR